MADANLRVKSTDNASKTLKGIEGRVEKLRIGIARLRNRMLLASFATGVLTASFIKVIKAAKIQEDAERKLNATLKSTGEIAGLTFTELTKMASGLQKITTFGDEAIIEAQSLLLTFTKIGKDVFPNALKTILDVSAGMGQDLKASTIQLGKALNDPIQGIAALSRVGVQLSDDQKDQVKSFVELNDIASAQAVILKELNTQFGGQAEAAADGLGSVTQLGNAFGDLVEDLGFAISSSEIFKAIINSLTVSFEVLSGILGRSDEERKVLTASQIKLNAALEEEIRINKEIEQASRSRSGFVSDASLRRKAELEKLIPTLRDNVQKEKELEEAKKKRAQEDKIAEENSKIEIKALEKKLAAMEADVEAFEEAGNKRIAKLKEESEARQLAIDNENRREEEAKEEKDKRDEEFFEKQKKKEEAEDRAVARFLERERDKRAAAVETVSVLASAFSTLASINKKFAGIAKATAIADATIQGFLAVQRALASSPPPFNFALAAAVGIKTAANVAKISSTSLQTPFGGERVIPGAVDQPVPVIAHGGETIGRRGGGDISIQFNGITGDPSDTAQQVIQLIREEQSRTGFGV